MGELASEQDRDLISVLSDGKWHPIMSGLSIMQGEPSSFWVSELAEDDVFDPTNDHSQAQCFLVKNFASSSWAREADSLFATGRASNLDSEHDLCLLALEEISYLRHRLPSL